MSGVDRFVEMLGTDPETLSGVPSDTQIIDQYKLAGIESLTPAVRSGFLEMWLPAETRATIETLEYDNLQQLSIDASEQLAELEETSRRIENLRFINTAAKHALAVRKDKKEK